MNSEPRLLNGRPLQQDGLTHSFARQRVIAPHRAIRRLYFPPERSIQLLVLPLAFSLVLPSFFNAMAAVWHYCFEFWLQHLAIDAEVVSVPFPAPWLVTAVPQIQLASIASPETYMLNIFLVCLLLLSICLWLPGKWLPLKYMMLLFAFLQLVSLAYFYFTAGKHFNHTATSHVNSLISAQIVLMFLLPWIHSLTYYIFEFSIWKKLGLTCLNLAFFFVFAPMLALMHAYLLFHFSVLLMPTLYFFFGLILPIAICIAFYSWGVSWESRPLVNGE